MAFLGREVGTVLSHHVQKAVCDSRAAYREGRRPRAVKVYTVNLESKYLLIQGVPAVGAMKELVERFALYGAIEQYNALDEYPAEEFTEVYLIKFMRLQSARMAKRKMDEQSFFGGLLHVCYAPEFETVEETRKKLIERKAYVTKVTQNNEPKDTRDSTQDFQKAESSGFSVDTSKNPGNSDPCLPYSCELPLCYFSSQCKCSSMEHVNRAPESSQDGGRYNRTAGHCNHSGSLHRKQTKNSSVACPRSQAAASPSEAVDRFMPRTTQLQERKRRREDDRKRGAFPETSTSSNDVMIGPRLPDIPKVDLHDDSLNTTANIIRNKLKEVISAVPKSPGDSLEDVRISHPLKQRRRI